MKKRLRIIIEIIIVLVLIILLDYKYGQEYNKYLDKIFNFYKPILNEINPCTQLINYSIGDFDDRFNISTEDFLKHLEVAEKIWEEPMGRNLFNYTDSGNLRINLVYDYRQEATDKLRKLGIVIDDNQESYDKLKSNYTSLMKQYDTDKANLDALVKDYQAKKNIYEKNITTLNKKKNISLLERQKIEANRIALNNQANLINKTQNELKNLVDDINATANVVNRLTVELNLRADNYNTIGQTIGKEFQEGEYVLNASGEKITIYQFDNKNKLIRVLAHELGHALGLEHNNNPDSIMYALNEGKNEKLSATDVEDLRSLCGIK